MTEPSPEALIVRCSDGSERRLESDAGPLTIGRSGSADWTIEGDARLSRLHASLSWDGRRGLLVPHSAKGVHCDGRRVHEPLIVSPGHTVTLGGTELTLVDPGDPEGTRAVAPAQVAARTATSAPIDVSSLRGTPDSDPTRSGRLLFLGLLALLAVPAWTRAAPAFAPILSAGSWLPPAMALATLLCGLALIQVLNSHGQVRLVEVVPAVLWGATIAAAGSATLTGGLVELFGLGDDFPVVRLVVLAPIIEELLKGAGLVLLFLILPGVYRGSGPGLALGAATGLGFALTENALYAALSLADPEAEPVREAAARLVQNALLGHPLYAAVTGAALGLLRDLPTRRDRIALPFVGVVVAIGLHMTWNAIVSLAPEAAPAHLITALAALAGLGAVFAGTLARQHVVVHTTLAAELHRGGLAPHDLESFRAIFEPVLLELRTLLESPGDLAAVRLRHRSLLGLARRRRELDEFDAGDPLLRYHLRNLERARARLDPSPEASRALSVGREPRPGTGGDRVARGPG